MDEVGWRWRNKIFRSDYLLYRYRPRQKISYRGNSFGEAYLGTGAGRIHHYFPMEPGEWKAYHFDFAEDYKAEYGVDPGSNRRIVIRAYQDSDFCDVWVDDIAGAVEEPAPQEPAAQVLIDDPSFVKLTAVPVTGENDIAFKLRIQACNPTMPVEVCYLVLDPSGSPSAPTQGVEVIRTE